MLTPALRAERIAPELLVLLGEREHAVLNQAALVEVVTQIDGVRSKEQVLLAAGELVGDSTALAAFERLVAAGYVIARLPDEALPAAAFWGSQRADIASALPRLAEAPIEICALANGVEPRLLDEVRAALHGAGLTQARIGGGRDGQYGTALRLCVVDDYLQPELERVNLRQLAQGSAWCLVNPISAGATIGPVFEPGRGPCWECLAYWVRANRPLQEALRLRRQQQQPLTAAPSNLPPSRAIALGLLSLALAQHVLQPSTAESLRDRVLRFDPSSLQVSHHRFVRRPQCPSCGDAQLMRRRMQTRPQLRPVRKQLPHRGGYRRADATDTFERFAGLIDPELGAVKYLSRVSTDRDAAWGLPPVFGSGYAASVDLGSRDLASVRVCAGKGSSLEQARVSALCEALERRSGQFEGDEAVVRASARELGPSALLPQQLLSFSARQYAERARTNREGIDRALWIPEPLPADVAIDWTPAHSLTSDRTCYVPLSYCFSACPPASGGRYCNPCGNGVAAGTCLEEAVLQGLLELVERDAVAIWWYNRIRRPAVAQDSLPAALRSSLSAFQALGDEAFILDLTHDLRIPTFVAVRLRRTRGATVLATGFGCHLHAGIALERAVTELHQLGDGIHPNTGKAHIAFDRLTDTDFLRPHPGIELDANVLPVFDAADLRADIEECLARLRARDCDAWVVNKTRPDLGLNVAHVIAPGLRHIWPRLAPGRLYDVPVQLGWRSEPHAESALTQVPLLL